MKPLTRISLRTIFLGLFGVYALIAAGRDNNTSIMDNHGHQLDTEWKEFYDAEQKDLPQAQQEALEKIILQSSLEHLDWDFYDAQRKYVEVVSRQNWKERPTAEKRFRQAVGKWDSPLLGFLYRHDYENTEAAAAWLQQHAAVLQKEKHENIYHHYDPLDWILNGKLPYFMENDYEYGLWLLSRHDFARWKKELKVQAGDGYPKGACLEWMEVEEKKPGYRKKTEAAYRTGLESLISRYEGRAIGIYAGKSLLELDAAACRKDDKSTEQDYRSLQHRAQDLLADARKLKRTEKRLVSSLKSVERLLEDLEAPAFRMAFHGQDSVSIYLRNLGSADFIIWRDNEEIFKQEVHAPSKVFYLEQQVKLALPALDDGCYEFGLKKGKMETSRKESFYGLSIAERAHREGWGIYVADCMTGEPVETADLFLYKNDRQVGKAEHFRLGPGFTELPDSFQKKLKRKNAFYYLEAVCRSKDGRLRRSPQISLMEDLDRAYRPPQNRAQIYLSQGAYRPGEEVAFKSILYRDLTGGEGQVLEAGTPVKALLYDSEDEIVASLDLETDGWGAVAGKIELPLNRRNGRFYLEIKEKDENLAWQSFLVEEFTLPTFYAAFQPQEKWYAPGEEVAVRGQVRSYSDHPVTAARASCQVRFRNEIIQNGPVELDEDGQFIILFRSQKKERYGDAFYQVLVTLTDPTGETHEFREAVGVCSALDHTTTVQNQLEGDIRLLDKGIRGKKLNLDRTAVVQEDFVLIRSEMRRSGPQAPMAWKLEDEAGNVLSSGSYSSGEDCRIGLEGLPDALYILETATCLKKKDIREDQSRTGLLKLSAGAVRLDAPVEYLWDAWNTDLSEGPGFGVRFGTTDGPVWAIAELYTEDRELLESRTLHLDGQRGKTGGLELLSFLYQENWPETVQVQLFYFKQEEAHCFQKTFRRARSRKELPLSFTSFRDMATPQTHYEFTLQTLPETQCLAAIYDKSLDEISPNVWNPLSLRKAYLEEMEIGTASGFDLDDDRHRIFLQDDMTENMPMYTTGRPTQMIALRSAGMAEKNSSGAVEVQPVRKDFTTSICFEPFLQSDGAGQIRLAFNTSDQLSTFTVSLMAHNRKLQQALLRKDLVVTVPVKVAVSQPDFLYDGDRWEMETLVSSHLDEAISGTLTVQLMAGKEIYKTHAVQVKLPARGSASERFSIQADLDRLLKLSGKKGSDGNTVQKDLLKQQLGIKISFLSEKDQISDGILLEIPVLPARQKLTESHSAVMLSGRDQKEIYEDLRSRFVNGSGRSARATETRLADLVRSAVPDQIQPEGKDVISLSDALYLQTLSRHLGGSAEMSSSAVLKNKILACRNGDGGFSWLEGLKSNPAITAMLLERAARLSRLETWEADWSASVQYLDNEWFDTERPYWCGRLSLEQYLYVRSLYPEVPFKPRFEGRQAEFEKLIREFEEAVADYLVPQDRRGLEGRLFQKARRAFILMRCCQDEAGAELARSWGLDDPKTLSASLEEDIASLLEYAVPHQDGGCYYPNLVMPFRGLLESEAYAHALVCNLLSQYAGQSADTQGNRAGKVADGIRIWLMVQKESQKWEEDPSFVDALDAVLSGSEEIQETTLVSLTQNYEKPLEEVLKSGNGMRIDREFYQEDLRPGFRQEPVRIEEGHPLEVGQKLLIRYRIHSDENRSFAKVTAWREANLTPAVQKSGCIWGYSSTRDLWHWGPAIYRDLHADRTDWYLEVLPEEETVLEEEFYVTRAGNFMAPGIEIECQYAPHYRANERCQGYIFTK